jgi:hypothetical protein
MAGEIKIQKFGCSVLEYTVDIFNGFISTLLLIQFYIHHKFQLHLNSKSFCRTFSKHVIYALALITVSFYINTRKFDIYSLYISGVAKSANQQICKINFLEYSSEYLP